MELLHWKVIKILCLEYLPKFIDCTLLILLCRLLAVSKLPPGWSLVSSYRVERVPSSCIEHLPVFIELCLLDPWVEANSVISRMEFTPPLLWITCDTLHRWKGLYYPLDTWRHNLTHRAMNVSLATLHIYHQRSPRNLSQWQIPSTTFWSGIDIAGKWNDSRLRVLSTYSVSDSYCGYSHL